MVNTSSVHKCVGAQLCHANLGPATPDKRHTYEQEKHDRPAPALQTQERTQTMIGDNGDDRKVEEDTSRKNSVTQHARG